MGTSPARRCSNDANSDITKYSNLCLRRLSTGRVEIQCSSSLVFLRHDRRRNCFFRTGGGFSFRFYSARMLLVYACVIIMKYGVRKNCVPSSPASVNLKLEHAWGLLFWRTAQTSFPCPRPACSRRCPYRGPRTIGAQGDVGVRVVEACAHHDQGHPITVFSASTGWPGSERSPTCRSRPRSRGSAERTPVQVGGSVERPALRVGAVGRSCLPTAPIAPG